MQSTTIIAITTTLIFSILIDSFPRKSENVQTWPSFRLVRLKFTFDFLRVNIGIQISGDGNRNCIGMRFALLQTKLGISTMVKNFNLSLNERSVYPPTLNPKDLLMSTLMPSLIDAERIL